MKTTTCATCQTVFEIPAKKPQQKYCCRECWRKGLLKQVARICETCGEAFSVYQARGGARWCSWECRSAVAEIVCEYCGDTFYVKRSHAHLRHTCSRSCSAKLQATKGKSPHQGQPHSEATKQRVSDGLKLFYNGNPEKHWNYQGGEFSQRRGPTWNEQRDATRARDSYTCQCCGITEEQIKRQLSVHHIKPFRYIQNHVVANQLSNLISTCQSCHMKLEHGTIKLPKQFLAEPTPENS